MKGFRALAPFLPPVWFRLGCAHQLCVPNVGMTKSPDCRVRLIRGAVSVSPLLDGQDLRRAQYMAFGFGPRAYSRLALANRGRNSYAIRDRRCVPILSLVVVPVGPRRGPCLVALLAP